MVYIKYIGYIIIVALIISVISILNKRFCLMQSEDSIIETDYVRNNVYNAHLYITKLLTLGESVINWDYLDYDIYHNQRLMADSILLDLKSNCTDLVCRNKIDTLCALLEAKETHLFRIMRTIHSWKETDSMFTRELPVIAKQTVRMKTITRKKGGVAGLFGKKESIRVPYYTNELSDFTHKLDSVNNWRDNQMEISVDSLRAQNKLLNVKLNDLVSLLNKEIQRIFTENNKKILDTQQDLFRQLAIVMTIVAVVLVIFFFIFRFDLQREKKIKLKLEQAIQENENLLEIRKKIILTVSHDIRGPLGNIHNCADLASETREKKKREIYLEDIRHSCHHILHLVNDLIDAYRMNEAGNLRNDTPFYLDRFLQRISDEFSRKANAKALIFYPEHEISVSKVKGDADKLEQVLANLLTNAIKFTPFGNIKFHTKYSGGKLLVEISDTGIGMDNETVDRIFSPFERAAQNVNSEGFGLGLFLTKGLVKVLNGTMEVESEPNKGSVFRLEFPFPETDELVEDDKEDYDSITVLPKKVLVVDDDPIQLKIAEDLLGRNGIACTTCMNVKEVVAALSDSNYDIILTDVQMPETDGFGLLKLLRNSDIGNSRTVPVAVMTARSDGNTGIYEKEGFAGCIHKPFNIRGLLTFLSSVMSQTKVLATGEFNFSCLLKNTEDYEYMLSLVIRESGKELEDLESAMSTTDREAMRKTIHRMIPVWEMLGKDYLLREFQKMLHEEGSSNETLREYTQQVIDWLKKLIEETKNELKKYENPDC